MEARKVSPKKRCPFTRGDNKVYASVLAARTRKSVPLIEVIITKIIMSILLAGTRKSVPLMRCPKVEVYHTTVWLGIDHETVV